MGIDKKKSCKAISDYINYATNGKGYSNNHVLLKSQKVNIYVEGHCYCAYESEISIRDEISSDNYSLTIMDDTLGAYLHKCIFWTSKYNFQFIDNCLIFEHEDKKIEISL